MSLENEAFVKLLNGTETQRQFATYWNRLCLFTDIHETKDQLHADQELHRLGTQVVRACTMRSKLAAIKAALDHVASIHGLTIEKLERETTVIVPAADGKPATTLLAEYLAWVKSATV